jgi:hypothetical protein
MAKFKFVDWGPLPSAVADPGLLLKLRIPMKSGAKHELVAPDQSKGWVLGEVIDHDITDDRALRMMRADPRFQEVL